MNKIDCRYTDEVVCPYCGHEFSDSWDFGESAGETNCNKCDKVFSFNSEMTVTYSSERDCSLNDQEHQWEDGRTMTSGSMLQHCLNCDQLRFV